MDRDEARVRYGQHKAGAKARGIEWEFTFEEWCEVWAPHWPERGRGASQLGMCRTHDTGPYSPGNVRLDTPKGNAAERGLMHKLSRTYLHLPVRPAQRRGGIATSGFRSYGNFALRPDKVIEAAQEEYEWIPGV